MPSARGHLSVVVCALVLLVSSPKVRGEEGLSGSIASITYLTSSTVYIGAGRDDGIDKGDILEVVRGEEIVARLEVTDLSSRRASCRIVSGEVELAVGDDVRFVPRQRDAEPSAPVSMPPPPSTSAVRRRAKRERGLRPWGLRGRAGMRYLTVSDRSGQGSSFSQPALDLRIDGRRVFGTDFGMNVDVRTRRTHHTFSSGETSSESYNRVYRLAASWNPQGSPLEVRIGRQYATALANVSIFDGVLAQWRRRRWLVGAFTGTQPDPRDFGRSNTVREHGGFFQLRGDPEAGTRWSLTTGVVGSYEQGEINREFAYLQGRYLAQQWSVYLVQEIDVNRGWRRQAEGSSLTGSSTYASLRYRISESLTLNGGFDNRRHIRLYRDIETPETEFDDSYRQGAWLGGDWHFLKNYRLGVSTRINRGGSSGSSDSTSLTFGAERLTRWEIDLRTRSTYYGNQRNDGWLHSFSIGMDLARRAHVEVSGGVRNEVSRIAVEADRSVNWYGVDIDFGLRRSWFMLASWERTGGSGESNDQLYTSVVYRF